MKLPMPMHDVASLSSPEVNVVVQIIAGVDVGNSTTEIVIVDASATPPTPIVWDRIPTRGIKGSAESALAAALVVRRLAKRAGVSVDAIVIAPQHPVNSQTVVINEPPPDTGRLAIIGAGTTTPAGQGLGVGKPMRLTDEIDTSGPVVLAATDPRSYRATSARVNEWLAAGAAVVGVVLAGDEAVLVANRINGQVPVVDQVDVNTALLASLVAVEVSQSVVRDLSDPVRISALVNLDRDEHPDAEAISQQLRGLRDAAIAVFTEPAPTSTVGDVTALVDSSDGLLDLRKVAVNPLPAGQPGAIALDGHSWQQFSDLWAVDLAEVADASAIRARSVNERAMSVATLAEVDGDPINVPASILTNELDLPVFLVTSEATAARVGALSTPAANPDAMVLDLGGGTIDAALADNESIVVAGAGDLLTAAVAHLLDIPRGAAEWVKREPSARLEGPHVLVGEDGVRRFVDVPVSADAVGALVVPGPAGLLPFNGQLAPGEWRMLRHQLKRAIISRNIERATTGLDTARDAILVGGPAGDTELLDMAVRALPGCTPGRADVAGVLGHRWAVAYGLTLLHQRGDAEPA